MKLEEKFKRNEVPTWLLNYKKWNKINLKKILSSEVCYYPGAGFDPSFANELVRANVCYSFIHADYGHDKEKVIKEYSNNVFENYHLVDYNEFNESDMNLGSIRYHITLSAEEMDRMRYYASKQDPYGLVFIYERNDNVEEGLKRFALIYLHSDGVAAYDALFCNQNKNPEFFVLVEHGFGGNYTSFGKEGLLNRLMENTNNHPNYVLTSQYSSLYDGYKDTGVYEIEGHHHTFMVYERMD